MRFGLGLLFFFIFVWTICVVLTLANPGLIFGPLGITIAVLGAVIIGTFAKITC